MNDVPALHTAERVGFEPTVRGCRTTVFKTVSFGRSDNAPGGPAQHDA